MTSHGIGSIQGWGQALFAVVLLGSLSGCEHKKFTAMSEADRIREAEALYFPEIFDTLTWESAETRNFEGNVVYASKCRDCHGIMGAGGTDYALERDLDVPSLVDADWEFADDMEGLRHRIFVGHLGGMPTWAVAGISHREIDAAAHYLVELLRPEVLGSDGR